MSMSPKNMRAVAAALFLGTCATVATGVLTATPAEAAIRSSVGRALNAAKESMGAGNCNAAMAHVREAESVGGLSSEEQKIIGQMKSYIASASRGACGADTAIGAQAKFSADWRARRYRDVIADGDMLRKAGALNGQSMQVIAQAYYYLHDYDGCVRYARAAGGGAGVLEWQMRCALEGHDDATYLSALEQLVSATNKPEYWGRLIKYAEGAKAISDHQSLDVYRIKFLTGGIKTADDYFVMAQYALQFGFAAEAKAALDAGIKNNVLGDTRAQRLVRMASDQLASNLRNLPRTESEARKAKNGDLLVKLGEDYCGMGRGKDAVAAVQAGIAKGTSDPDNAQVRLGQAYYIAGQKAQAVAAFSKVKGKGNPQLVAHLWSLYVRTH
jgi:hypothetical protein